MLSTLYLSFAYLVYAIVLLLVIGYKNLGALEWTGLAGGPVLYVDLLLSPPLLCLTACLGKTPQVLM